MKKFYNMPPSWNPGYAIPDYVMAEPPGRGTFTTKWLPRGSISTLDPSFVADPGKRLLGRNDAGLGSLGDVTIGAASSLAGHTLEGNSLAGDSLGAGRVYNLEPFGDLEADARASMAATSASNAAAYNKVAGAAVSTMKFGAILTVAAIGGVAYFLLRKKRS